MKKYLILVFIIYIISRLLIVSYFPLFFDEAIYIHWSQFIADDWFWKYISLIDGKQPLFIWIVSLFIKIFSNPITAGRFVSLISGLFNLFGIYLISKKLFDKKTALIAAIFYVLVPFYLIYDSLALMDTLLMSFAIWSIYFSIRFSLFSGVLIGLGLLTKSSAAFLLYLFPLNIILYKIFKKHQIFASVKNFIIVFIIAKGIESTMRFSSYYPIIAKKNSEFVRSISEVFKENPVVFLNNLKLISSWVVGYLGLVSVFALTAIIIKNNKKREIIFLSLYSFVPILAMVILGKQMYPRYFLFMTFPLVILSSYMLTQIKNKILFSILVIFTLIPFLRTDYYLVSKQYQKVQIPQIERWQFFDGMPSGVGIEKLYEFFDKTGDKILILTDRSNGTIADGLGLRYHKNSNITVKGFDGIKKEDFPLYLSGKSYDTIYLVLSWQELDSSINAKQILKVENNNNWRIYKII